MPIEVIAPSLPSLAVSVAGGFSRTELTSVTTELTLSAEWALWLLSAWCLLADL